jgi:hypothetical protein
LSVAPVVITSSTIATASPSSRLTAMNALRTFVVRAASASPACGGESRTRRSAATSGTDVRRDTRRAISCA